MAKFTAAEIKEQTEKTWKPSRRKSAAIEARISRS